MDDSNSSSRGTNVGVVSLPARGHATLGDSSAATTARTEKERFKSTIWLKPVGIVNVPAVQQQYGQNFGHSVIPYWPPPPVFTSPLGHR
jgi:hypothetical protein